MKNVELFLKLYLTGVYKTLCCSGRKDPNGIRGSLVLNDFVDIKHDPNKKHGVVVFVLPPGVSLEDFADDLYGPLGYSSEVAYGTTFRLYARDTWGPVEDYQLEDNPRLKALRDNISEGCVIVLAGVRRFMGIHLPPLNDPSSFILVKSDNFN